MAARGRGLVFQVLIMKYCKGNKSCKRGCFVCREIFSLIVFIEIATIMMGLSITCFNESQ